MLSKHLHISDNIIDDLLKLVIVLFVGVTISLGYKPVGMLIALIVCLAIFVRVAIEVARWFNPSFLMKRGKSK